MGSIAVGTKVRSGAIDGVRILGVVAVVAGHTFSADIWPFLYSWHVPIFFFLSGYLWTGDRTVADEIRRRTPTLLKPYVAWFVILFVPYIAVAVVSDNGTLGYFFGPIYGGRFAGVPFSTFWFVSVLFFTVVLVRILELLPESAKLVACVAGVVAGIFWGDLLAATPLAFGSAVSCAIFVVAGEYAMRIRANLKRPFALGVALLAASIILIATGLSDIVNIKGGSYGTPFVSVAVAIAISFALVLIVESMYKRLPPLAHRCTTNLALAGFTVVLLHPAVLWVGWGWLPSGVLFLVAVILPWVVGLVALRTPVSGWLTGVPPTTKQAVSQ
jgi:acyltransferase